jgi:3-polyprenyl-4-hydroxybenzoate decarboxylase
MALPIGQKQNFETLQEAFANGDVALMECQLASNGEPVAVICAANRLPDGQIEFVPFASLFSGNPYEAVNPPNPDGGFFSQDEV